MESKPMRDARRVLKKAEILPAVLLFACQLQGGSAQAVLLTWQGATGNWDSVFSWSPSGPPNSTTDVEVYNGGTVRVTSAAAQGQDIFLGTVSPHPLEVGAGHLQVLDAPAALNARHIYVGYDTTGTLNITSGGKVFNNFSIIGAYGLATGEVTVAGPGSQWASTAAIDVGHAGHGTLNILDGGTVSSFAANISAVIGSSGMVIVDGVDSEWVNTDALYVGTRGEGELRITSGGAVSNSGRLVIGGAGIGWMTIADGGHVSNTIGDIGDYVDVTSGQGVVTVTGTGSTWANSGGLAVGTKGWGFLKVEAGGTVSSTIGYVGSAIGAMGLATVNGAESTWTNSADMSIGYQGRGTLEIKSGGTVSNVNGFLGRLGAGAVGKVTVDGTGSTWTNAADLSIGYEGTGTLEIKAGGAVSNVNGSIGRQGGSSGEVTVTGTDSTWINSEGLNVGDSGVGSLTITDGGKVGSASANISRFATPGFLSRVTVDGHGSEWTNTSGIAVGTRGVGELIIRDGGAVSSGESFIGSLAGAVGIAQVYGQASTWNSDDLNVGYLGSGAMYVQSGGAVSTANNAFIGRLGLSPNASSGVVFVGVDDAVWSVGGRLSIGGDAVAGTAGGSGTLEIGAGGRVSVAQDIVVFPTGNLTLQGGTLDAQAINLQNRQFHWTAGTLHVGLFGGDLLNQGGTLAPGHSAGDLVIQGDYTQQRRGVMEIEIGGSGMGSQYDFINVIGDALVDGNLQLKLIDGFVPSPSQTFLVFSANSLVGVFDNAGNNQRVTTGDGGGSFLVHYGVGSAFDPTQIVLSDFQAATLPGDYNQDGIVDAADYVVWLDTLAQTGTGLAADGDGDGTIDSDDYGVWTAHFGQIAGSGAARSSISPPSAAVPEPPAIPIAGFAVFCGLAGRRNKDVVSGIYAGFFKL